MLEVFFKVAFSFCLGMCAPTLIAEFADFVMGARFTEALFGTRNGASILVISGLASVSWMIRKGEFVDDMKSTH